MNPIVWRNIFPTFYLFTEPVKEWKSARFPSPFLQNLLLQALARREWTWSFFLWNSTQTIPLSYIMRKKNICFSTERKVPEGADIFAIWNIIPWKEQLERLGTFLIPSTTWMWEGWFADGWMTDWEMGEWWDNFLLVTFYYHEFNEYK